MTLIPADGERVWGIAFQLPADLEERRTVLQVCSMQLAPTCMFGSAGGSCGSSVQGNL